MKKIIKLLIVVIALLSIICFIYFKGDLFDNKRTYERANALLDYSNINISDVSVEENHVVINGILNREGYIITDYDFEKKGDILYISVYGGYGVSQELKIFNFDHHFDGEKINTVIMKGNKKKTKVIWQNR